jgi:hypothetical protein
VTHEANTAELNEYDEREALFAQLVIRRPEANRCDESASGSGSAVSATEFIETIGMTAVSYRDRCLAQPAWTRTIKVCRARVEAG